MGAKASEIQTKIERPEIFFALIGAAGTDLARVETELTRALAGVGYRTEAIRVSALIAAWAGRAAQPWADEAERLTYLMNEGDRMRKESGDGGALMSLVCSDIKSRRIRVHQGQQAGRAQDHEQSDIVDLGNTPVAATAYIIRSLKHPHEATVLRRVYGESVFLISAYAPRSQRIEFLAGQIARSLRCMVDDAIRRKAVSLIEIDERRPGTDIGQNLRDVFPLADAFVSMTPSLPDTLRRIVELIFGNPFLTPQRDEYWMFHARAAAMRSADLSRQVGAVIISPDDTYLTGGCNDVPRSGGGIFWDGDDEAEDSRDFRLGYDANAIMRNEIVAEFLEWLGTAHKLKEPAEKITAEILTGPLKTGFKETRLANLIEFGRVVHAEMHALSDAARRGIGVDRAVLYSTTFPCHMCARHILAAGISRVVYIEPYPKSLTTRLYGQLIASEADECEDKLRTRFEPFVGIAPHNFQRLFEWRPRKDGAGYALSWDAVEAIPSRSSATFPYIDLETAEAYRAGRDPEEETDDVN
ncbi:anti-phage dCTP deaminase [Tistrella bauzanensis]|uniref:Anti-phage dCTP deaminase n=1 Tax=Tistrella arctica TaxID=3133430 RepID=A0ABU9YGY7_9PROT